MCCQYTLFLFWLLFVFSVHPVLSSLSQKLPPSRIFRCLCGVFTHVSFWKASDTGASRTLCEVSWESLQLGPPAVVIILNSSSLLFSGASATSSRFGLLHHLVKPSSANFLWKEYFGSLNSEAFISEEHLYWLLGWMSDARLEIICPQHKEVSAQLPFSIFYVSAYRVSLTLFLKSVMPFWVDALLFLLGCCKFWEISLNCFYKSSTVLEGWLIRLVVFFYSQYLDPLAVSFKCKNLLVFCIYSVLGELFNLSSLFSDYSLRTYLFISLEIIVILWWGGSFYFCFHLTVHWNSRCGYVLMFKSRGSLEPIEVVIPIVVRATQLAHRSCWDGHSVGNL